MESYSFKHWSNKKYAILGSMHKVIRIGTLSVVYTLLQLQPVLAQSDTASPVLYYDLEEVESISENETEIYSPSLRTISTILQKQIISSPAPSLAELIDNYPLTDIRTRGYHGIQSDLNIQGGSFDQSIVLLNGLNISDPQTGHFNLNLPVSFSHLEKVEILVGPTTKTYGLNAYSGAVNLITSPADSIRMDAEIKVGQHQLYEANAVFHVPIGPLKSLLSISSGSSDGYRENTDFKHSGIYFHSNLQLKLIETDLMAGMNQKDFGANSFYSPRFPEQYEETSSQFVALKVASRGVNPSIESAFHWRRHYDHFLLFRNNPSFYENLHRSDVLEGNIHLKYSSVLGVTKIGATLRSEQIVSSSLGNNLTIPEPVSNNDSLFYSYGYQRNHPGLSLNHFIVLKRFKASAGLLAYYSPIEDKMHMYPGADMAYQLNKEWNMTVAINKSMRLPTFTDMFYQGPQNVGNPDLRPEEAITLESGIEYDRNGISSQLSLFYRMGDMTIDWVWQEDERWHTMNITELNTFGGAVSLSLDPAILFKNQHLLKHFQTSYSYTEINKSASAFISNYALDNLRHKFVLDMGISLPFNFSLYYNLRWYDRNGSYLSYDIESGESGELPYLSYWQNDLSLRYSLKQLSFFIDISNIFDVAYMDLGSVVQPGRWVIGGVRFSTGSK